MRFAGKATRCGEMTRCVSHVHGSTEGSGDWCRRRREQTEIQKPTSGSTKLAVFVPCIAPERYLVPACTSRDHTSIRAPGQPEGVARHRGSPLPAGHLTYYLMPGGISARFSLASDREPYFMGWRIWASRLSCQGPDSLVRHWLTDESSSVRRRQNASLSYAGQVCVERGVGSSVVSTSKRGRLIGSVTRIWLHVVFVDTSSKVVTSDARIKRNAWR